MNIGFSPLNGDTWGMQPAYIDLYKSGRLARCAEELQEILQHCTLCPHRCRVNRMEGERGKCGSGAYPVVSSCNAHFGEEAPLVGRYGSGTIFFTHCNLSCIFCQNYDISQRGIGDEISYHRLAELS